MTRRHQRIHEEPAYVLHALDWRETSLIVQLLTKNYGRLTDVEKGAKRPYSHLNAVLMSFQAIEDGWTGAGEIKTLTASELLQLHPLQSAVLLSAWYVN